MQHYSRDRFGTSDTDRLVSNYNGRESHKARPMALQHHSRDRFGSSDADRLVSNTMDMRGRNQVYFAEDLQEQTNRQNAYSSGVPYLSSLRQDQHISACVARRPAELGIHEDTNNMDNNMKHRRGKKSGLSQTDEDQIVNEIDWPHFYIYRGQERKPIQYTQITQSEFTYGFLAMLNNPRNYVDRELLLSILNFVL